MPRRARLPRVAARHDRLEAARVGRVNGEVRLDRAVDGCPQLHLVVAVAPRHAVAEVDDRLLLLDRGQGVGEVLDRAQPPVDVEEVELAGVGGEASVSEVSTDWSAAAPVVSPDSPVPPTRSFARSRQLPVGGEVLRHLRPVAPIDATATGRPRTCGSPRTPAPTSRRGRAGPAPSRWGRRGGPPGDGRRGRSAVGLAAGAAGRGPAGLRIATTGGAGSWSGGAVLRRDLLEVEGPQSSAPCRPRRIVKSSRLRSRTSVPVRVADDDVDEHQRDRASKVGARSGLGAARASPPPPGARHAATKSATPRPPAGRLTGGTSSAPAPSAWARTQPPARTSGSSRRCRWPRTAGC